MSAASARASLEEALRGAPLDPRLEWHESIGSTQARAAELVDAGAPAGTLVIAYAQTAGVGRFGHRWSSPPGGLYLSLVVHAPPPAGGPERALAISIVAALAAREAVERASGVAARLKWPNDLLVGRRKLGGVIATERAGKAILGIGIDLDVRRADLPPDVAAIATSTLEETGRGTAPGAVVRALLEALAPRLAARGRGDAALLAEARAHLIAEHPVRWTRAAGAEPLAGAVLGLEPSGALSIRTGGGPVTAASGDLEILWT